MQAQHQSSDKSNATTNSHKAGDSRVKDKFVVRLDDGMRERIAAVARTEHRSMNSEIVIRLERSLLTSDLVGQQTKLNQILLLRIEDLQAKLDSVINAAASEGAGPKLRQAIDGTLTNSAPIELRLVTP